MPAAVSTTAPIAQQSIDELEATIADLHCALLEELTPEEFARVQDLRRATQVVAVTRCVVTEAMLIELECSFLDSLSPEQAALVQQLQLATHSLATATLLPRQDSPGFARTVRAVAHALTAHAA